MREYEVTVVYDLAVAESGGADASVQHLTQLVEARGGKLLKVDHWGRRRMAYPIRHAIDGDYVVTRVELDPAAVNALEAALRIDERVYRHLVVRADELPVPPPPREPRGERAETPVAPAPAEAAVAGPEAGTPVTGDVSEEAEAAEPEAEEAPVSEAPAPAEAGVESAAAEAEAAAPEAEVEREAPSA